MEHNFNIAVAKELGIAPAVILNNIYWWIEKNRVDERNFYDGYYWTFMSRKGYCRYFPYLTERQIEYALRKLIDEGYLITGNYNKSAYDRTLWYRITAKGYTILQNCEIEYEKMLNEDNKIVKPIPDNKTNNKTDKKSLPKGKEEQAPKKSYKDVFEDPENKIVKDALVKFINACKGRNYNPKVDTVEKFAKTLRDNAKEDPALAMAMVDQSIEKGWKDIYPLKNNGAPVKKEAISIPVSAEDKAKNPDGSYVVY